MDNETESSSENVILRSARKLIGDHLEASDGEIGTCCDLLFDDHAWTIRYLVADTGGWLSGRRSLISPRSLGMPEFGAHHRTIPVALTKEQIRSAPPLDSHAPVSRRYELELSSHYDYPAYWAGTMLWGFTPYPVPAAPPSPEEQEAMREEIEDIERSHLRSISEVHGYAIHASDGEIGDAEDLIVEPKTWAIRYLVADTNRWLPGGKVLLAVPWIRHISWRETCVEVDLTREAVKGSPKFDSHEAVNRDMEGRLYDYYGRPRYWS